MPVNERPRFSIVIPCFNQGPFIHECLESVGRQTYPAHEVIVVNDGSTDPFTNARLRELCVPPTRLIEQENRGLSGARNTGVRAASGDWIIPLDADDLLREDALESYAEAIARAPEVDIWTPDIQHFGVEDSLYPEPPPSRWHQLWWNHFVCSAAIRRSIFSAGVYYNEQLRQGFEDWEFYIHAFVERGFEARLLEKPVFLYRRWGYSMLASAEERRQQIIQSMQQQRPIYSNREALLDLKRRDCPFFAWACATEDVGRALERQTFRDWRVIDSTGEVTRSGTLAVFRDDLSRTFVVSLDDAALSRALEGDPQLLDRVARVVETHPHAAVCLTTTSEKGAAYPGLLAHPSEAGGMPPLRSVGFVIPLEEVLLGFEVPRTEAGLPGDLIAAARSLPGGCLPLIVGHGTESDGFPLPPEVAVAPVEGHANARSKLHGRVRRASQALRVLIGEQRHDRLRHLPVACALRAAVTGRREAAANQEPTSARRIRTGPVQLERWVDSRFRHTIWKSSIEAPLRDAPTLGPGPGLLIAVPWLIKGGADKAIVDLIQGLARQAPTVRKYLVMTLRERMRWADEVLPFVDGIFSVPDHSPEDAPKLFCEIVDRFNIDTLLICNSQIAFDALPAIRQMARRIRVVTHVHSFGMDPATGKLTSHPAYAASRYNNLIDEYVTISQRLAGQLASDFYVSPTKLRTVYLGFDSARFSHARRQRFVDGRAELLWLGRLSGEKDPVTAVRVARAMEERYGSGRVHLTIAGGGPLEADVRRAVNEYRLGDIVAVTGEIDDPLPLYTKADALLMTSVHEGLPLVVVEAMLAGVCVIAPTRNTSIEEALAPADAYFVEDQSDPASYLCAIDRMLESPEAARAAAGRAVAKASRFELSRYTDEMLDAMFPGFRPCEARDVG